MNKKVFWSETFSNKPLEDLFVSFSQVFVLRAEDSILIKAGVIPEEITKHRQEFLGYEMKNRKSCIAKMIILILKWALNNQGQHSYG